MATALPSDVEYGYVADRVLRAVLDTPADPDLLPDGVPAKGSITFTPLLKVMAAGQGKVTVIRESYTFTIHQGLSETTEGAPVDNESKGLLVNPATGHTGSHAVVAGWYAVTYTVNGAVQTIPQLHVTTAFTQDEPMWIRQHAELVPEPSTRFVVNEFVYSQTIGARDQVLQAIADFVPGEIAPEDIEQAVGDYLAANPQPTEPYEHGHTIGEVEGLENELADLFAAIEAPTPLATWETLEGKPATYPPAEHQHEQYLTAEDLPTPPDLTGHVLTDDPRLTDARTPTAHDHDERYVRTVNGTGPDSAGNVTVAGGGGTNDHGALTGLDGDDHPQYLTQARGDARYAPVGDYLTEADLPAPPDLSGLVTSTTITEIWSGTQAAYDQLDPDPATLYIIVED